jgi:hypothetical protein
MKNKTVEVMNYLNLSDLADDLTAQLSHEDINDFILDLDSKLEDMDNTKDLIISLLESIDLNGNEIREIKDIIGEY